MNRMAPLVRRRVRNPGSFAAVAATPGATVQDAVRWMEDAKLFAAGWVAGLVVFGTLFG